eukprot:g3189.t1
MPDNAFTFESKSKERMTHLDQVECDSTSKNHRDTLQSEVAVLEESQSENDTLRSTDDASSHSAEEQWSSLNLKVSDALDQELLLRGYQLENEKATERIKSLENEISDLKTTVKNEQQKLRRQLLQATIERKEHEQELSTKEAQIVKLQQEMTHFKEVSATREQEMQTRLQSVCREKKRLESHLAGINLELMEEDDGVVKTIKNEMETMKKTHEEQVQSLKEQLKWYVENQQLLDSNEALLHEQSIKIVELERQLQSVEGGTKSQLLKKNKQLEQDLQCIKQAFSAKHPDSVSALIQIAKTSSEDLEVTRALESKVKELEEALKRKDIAYEMELRSLRQQHEKLKLVSSSFSGKFKSPSANQSRNSVSILKAKHSRELKRLQDQLKELRESRECNPSQGQNKENCQSSLFALTALQQQIEKNKKLETLLTETRSRNECQNKEKPSSPKLVHSETQTSDNEAQNEDRVMCSSPIKPVRKTTFKSKVQLQWDPKVEELKALEWRIKMMASQMETRQKEYQDCLKDLETTHALQLKLIGNEIESERKAQQLQLRKYELQVAEVLEAARVLKQSLIG